MSEKEYEATITQMKISLVISLIILIIMGLII